MADSKIEYKKRRKQGLRGQGDVPEPHYHKKGEDVKIMGWDADKKKYVEKFLPNNEGGHLMRTKSGFVRVNRKENRRRSVMRAATTSNYEYQKEKMGFKHPAVITDSRKEGYKHPEPTQDPTKTNHERMLQRKEARDARREAETARRK